tara:strand:+ start:443 stop:742 length:300 start_codon:yes stop_codon:yes gene_type:complete
MQQFAVGSPILDVSTPAIPPKSIMVLPEQFGSCSVYAGSQYQFAIQDPVHAVTLEKVIPVFGYSVQLDVPLVPPLQGLVQSHDLQLPVHEAYDIDKSIL